MITALLVAGAEMPAGYVVSESSPPIVQAFMFLDVLETKINNISTTYQRGLESKVDSEQWNQVIKLHEKILAITDDLEPQDKNLLCHRLAKMLEKALPCVPQTLVIEAYAKITSDSAALYQEAATQMLHYSFLNPQGVESKDSLEEEAMSDWSKQLTLALEATNTPPSLLSRLMIQTILGKEGQVSAHDHIVIQNARLSETITRSCLFLREQIKTPHSNPARDTKRPQAETPERDAKRPKSSG
jgi:hypothetical protein